MSNRQSTMPSGAATVEEPRTLPSSQAIPQDRELRVYRAQLCEQLGRFDEMAQVMKDMCFVYNDLSVDERNILSCAYKNVIGARRNAYRVISEALNPNSEIPYHHQRQDFSLTPRPSSTEPPEGPTKFNLDIVKTYLSQIASEVRKHCNDVLEILTTRLLTCATITGESAVFFYKMQGDYLRYFCEICQGPERKEKANESHQAYKVAKDRAIIELPPTHPVRLGLMLNFSVFYYEILRTPERAIRLARQSFDDAIAELDTLSEESYRDSTVIMQLLRDNMQMWETDQKEICSVQEPSQPSDNL